MASAIRVGVSSCLLGERVRYDGRHKHDRYIADILGQYFTFIPVCPEVGCGLPVPREAMHLEGDPVNPRLVTIMTRIDLTGRMQDYCLSKVIELEREDLSGFIFKSRSPSCAVLPIEVFSSGGGGRSRGLFAAALTEHFPRLPVEEEGRLNNPEIREDFIERVIAYSRILMSIPEK
jgi:uncharacterized protein YbbK (DUF523 family)